METANVVWVSCAECRVSFFKFGRISNFWHAGTWETQLLKNGHNLIVFMPILTGAVRASQSLV